MASVWKRLQRVNKRAAKFQYTASYHRIDLDTSAKWKPNKLSIVWTRRSRRVVSEPLEWEPSLKDPLKGSVVFGVPQNATVAVTLFKDPRSGDLEDKDWTFVLEDVSPTGKRRRLASATINMRLYASLSPSARAVSLALAPNTHKITAASIGLTLHSVLLREGRATDEDMQSLASLLSVNNNSDIAVLEDLDEDDYTLSDRSSKQVLDLRQQMEQLTRSLSSSGGAGATPDSVQSLNFDNSRTPTAPISPAAPDAERTPTANHDFADAFNDFAQKPEPIFAASTPNKQDTEPYPKFQFKPKAITKMNLKPLELKTNLNSLVSDEVKEVLDKNDNKSPVETPVDEKLFIGRMERDKTPVQDLLEWCQSVTAEYHQCKVTNLTSSFRSGLAFCAIIHHYRPDLIDFSGLQPSDAASNVRSALAASSALGLAPLIGVSDVTGPRGPDKLAIMTYLFQMRARFTGGELRLEQLGEEDAEASYLVGRHDTDGLMAPELFSREVVARRSQRAVRKYESPTSNSERSTPEKVRSPSLKETKDILHTNNLIGKMLSPAKELRPLSVSNTKWFTDPLHISSEPPPKPERLMTRKELTDPFGSDEEEEEPHRPEDRVKPEQTPSPDREERISSPASPLEDLPKPTPQLLSRHDELKERARQLLEATKREAREKERGREEEERNGDVSKKSMSEDERQAMLRERARKLIADARAGIVSPTSPSAVSRGRVEIISKQSVMDEVAQGNLHIDMLSRDAQPPPPEGETPQDSPDRSESRQSSESRSRSSGSPRRSPLKSFAELVQRLTPDKDNSAETKESGSYIQSEQEALEKEQKAVDSRAAQLERQLRGVMESGTDAQEEDRLLAQWFNLVNKKNALLRRQMQLNILEQEEDLSKRCELLARELRLSLAVDEWRKTQGQKRRERLLLQELLEAVNERDRLVQEMDEQEKAIADDDEIERNLSQVELQRKNNCILQ